MPQVLGSDRRNRGWAGQTGLMFLERIANALLRLDPESVMRLSTFKGKVIRICVIDGGGLVPPPIYVLPSDTDLRLRTQCDVPPDITLRGRLPAFTALLRSGATGDGFSAGELEIDGDAELGQRLQQFVRELDIDWEEQAARVIGDIAAHQLGNVVRAFAAWQRESVQTLGADLTEYLQEESRLLAPRTRVEAFFDAVDVLRSDADRLELRLRSLLERTR
jgi:ubiquinone biosynthesis protein UbiJ